MIEIPESQTISLQAGNALIGKQIAEVRNATRPHKFTWYSGDPKNYTEILTGKRITSARGHGMFVDILCEGDTCITICDGTNMRFYPPAAPIPDKFQLMIRFQDDSRMVFTVAMYGGIWAYRGTFDNPYHRHSLSSISPLEDSFDEPCFDSLINVVTKDLSAKALLATQQRIPGLGNGVLQDILFHAGIHPKRKKSTLTDFEKGELFYSIKVTLKKMTEMGGRDTEKDFFGCAGGYKTVLSKNTADQPCPNCGHPIVKEAYLGGAVYFCRVCQKV